MLIVVLVLGMIFLMVSHLGSVMYLIWGSSDFGSELESGDYG